VRGGDQGRAHDRASLPLRSRLPEEASRGERADRAPMNDKLHIFEGHGIRVSWSKARCIHSAECVRGLPLVFQPGSRPWIKPDAGAAARIAEVIERCPTGALHY